MQGNEMVLFLVYEYSKLSNDLPSGIRTDIFIFKTILISEGAAP